MEIGFVLFFIVEVFFIFSFLVLFLDGSRGISSSCPRISAPNSSACLDKGAFQNLAFEISLPIFFFEIESHCIIHTGLRLKSLPASAS